MSVESDGIEESFDSQMRVAAMAAMQAGDVLARQLTEQRRVQQQSADANRVELERRFEAERRMALAELQQVRNTDWWDNATPQQIADRYSLARGWSEHDPEIARVEEQMRRELETRYGIDPHQDQYADPQAVQSEIERIEQNRNDPSRQLETQEAAEAGRERGEARTLEERANTAESRAVSSEQAAETETDPGRAREMREQAAAEQAEAERLRGDAGHSWDSAERREATASRMRESGGSEQLVDTRMRADVSQGRPAHEAAAKSPGSGAKAQKGRRVPGRGQQRQR